MQGLTLPGNLFGIKAFFSVPDDWVPDSSMVPDAINVQYAPPATAVSPAATAAGEAPPAAVAEGVPFAPAAIAAPKPEEPHGGAALEDKYEDRTDSSLKKLDLLIDNILDSMPPDMEVDAKKGAPSPLVPTLTQVLRGTAHQWAGLEGGAQVRRGDLPPDRPPSHPIPNRFMPKKWKRNK